ncbi:MAG: acyltransferase family protein [Steroidobacterales bacterium]
MRALAVSAVVLYHAQPSALSGGYVGVDVFLVLSGFLITGLIMDQDAARTFRIATFYQTRAWRILPALIAVTTATMLAAGFILGPRLFSALARSAIAALLFVPNVYFSLHQSYFESNAAEPALLHTWSLGLEEQFYVLFPLFLVALLHHYRDQMATILVAACVLSFALCIWLVGYHPIATFYLLPTRAWEFLLGALACCWQERVVLGRWAAELVAALGIAAIVLAAGVLTPEVRYPAAVAMLPCAGACAVLVANAARSTMAARLLSLWPLAMIGRLSYSLYLWHWPVFTFAHQCWGPDLASTQLVACFGLTCLAAVLSWRFVEERFRVRTSAGDRARPITPLVVATGAGLASALFVLQFAGFQSRLPPLAVRYEQAGLQEDHRASDCHHGAPELVAIDGICKLQGGDGQHEAVLVWGDSHANVIAPIAAELGAARGMSVLQATYSSCPPLLGVRVAYMTRSHHCIEFNNMVIAAARTLHIRRVILAAYWSWYLQVNQKERYIAALDPYGNSNDLRRGTVAENDAKFRVGLEATVRALKNLGIRVWVLQQVPSQARFVPETLAQAEWWTGSVATVGSPLAAYRARQVAVGASVLAVPGVESLLDPASALCPHDWCAAAADGNSLYIDAHHLSAAGAQLLKPTLNAAFD